jgi:AcrR family transcriptional regulator
VADEAGVTRLTVYRHFEDQDALFEACMGHWYADNPPPDFDAWRALEPLEARAATAFAELYTWYQGRHGELYPIYRDQAVMPDSAQRSMAALFDAMATVVIGPAEDVTSTPAAVARHLVDFWTWRSLVVERGLSTAEASAAAVAMLLAVGGRG